MSLADAFSKGYTAKKQAASAPKAEVAQKPDDGLGLLRKAASTAHGTRKKEYEAALKNADSKKI